MIGYVPPSQGQHEYKKHCRAKLPENIHPPVDPLDYRITLIGLDDPAAASERRGEHHDDGHDAKPVIAPEVEAIEPPPLRDEDCGDGTSAQGEAPPEPSA